jgi:hypothetical protein
VQNVFNRPVPLIAPSVHWSVCVVFSESIKVVEQSHSCVGGGPGGVGGGPGGVGGGPGGVGVGAVYTQLSFFIHDFESIHANDLLAFVASFFALAPSNRL